MWLSNSNYEGERIMAYTFTQDGQVLCETLESFWIYNSFDVQPSTNILEIKGGFLAVYFSQQPPTEKGTGPAVTRPKRDHIDSIEIKDAGGQTITLTNLSLLYSRLTEYRNERGYLHLYRMESFMLPDWFKCEWYKDYQITPKNDDQTEFMERTIDFDSVKEREVFALSMEESGEAIMGLTMVMPFLGDNMFNDILQAHKKEFPKLTINSKWHGQTFEFPDPAEQVRVSSKEGWNMICDGAFSALPMSAELDGRVDLNSWFFNDQSGGADVMSRLSTLVASYPTEDSHGGINRRIYNSKETGASAVIKTTKHPPYELFHMRDINDERMGKIISDKK